MTPEKPAADGDDQEAGNSYQQIKDDHLLYCSKKKEIKSLLTFGE